MRRIHNLLLVLVVSGGLAAVPSDAVARSVRATIYVDCQLHPGGLTGHYSTGELREALAAMPAEVSEYSQCVPLLSDQLNKQLAKSKIKPVTKAAATSGGSLISPPLLIVLVVIVLAGVGFGLSARKRGSGSGTPPSAPGDS